MRQSYRKAQAVLVRIGDVNEAFDVELAFRIANNRHPYAMGLDNLHILKETPLSSCSARTWSLCHGFAQHECTFESAEKCAAFGYLAELGGFFFISEELCCVGRRHVSAPDLQPNTNPVGPMLPDFSLEQIIRAASRESQDFEDCLEEATKLPEWTLSVTELQPSGLRNSCSRTSESITLMRVVRLRKE